MIIYVVTYNCYLQYKCDYTEVRGVFDSRILAELYIDNHKHEIEEDTHYDSEYFEIEEHKLNGGLDDC